MLKIYLAGPDVFKSNAIQIGEDLVAKCEKFGFQGLYPLDSEIELSGDKYGDGKKIADANVNMIHDCDIVLANLSPFRGPSADCGTVWECAYAKGLGKYVAGYTDSHHEPMSDKNNGLTPKFISYKRRVIGKIPHDGMMVEDFASFDNIMLVHGIDSISSSATQALKALEKKFSNE